jgi:lipid A 3-O-deacylase PagL
VKGGGSSARARPVSGAMARAAVLTAALIGGCAAAILPGPALAETPAVAPGSGPPAGTSAAGGAFVLAAGAVEIVDPEPRAFVSFEYRPTIRIRRPCPWVAAEATERDRFFGFGVLADFTLGRRTVLTPAFGAAIYLDLGGLGLGSHLEFRSSLEITARAGSGRVGARLAHYSNAGIGETNPGTEALLFVWVFPAGGA